MRYQVQKDDTAGLKKPQTGDSTAAVAIIKAGCGGGSRNHAIGCYLVCLLLCLPLLVAAQERHTAAPPKQTAVESPRQVELGRTLFKSSCALCHGLDGKGTTGPDLIRSPLLSHDDHGELIGPVIRNGRVDKGMPSYSNMKRSEIDSIVAFLHHQATIALHSNRLHGDYSLARMLTGNALQGKAFFEGAGGCSQCHSVTGDLAGIGKKYLPIELQQKMVYPASSKLSKTGIVTLKSGEKFGGKVVDEDEFNIGIICQDGWYRSWAKGDVQLETQDPLDAHRQLVFKYTDADLHNLFAYLERLK